MGDHVLVPHDGSEPSESALEYLVTGAIDADRVTLLTAIDPVGSGYGTDVALPAGADEWYDTAQEEARRHLDDAADRVRSEDLEVETVVRVGRPPDAILEYVEEGEAEHVLMGSHGRTGVSRLLLGSVAEEVVRRSPVPVTVVR